MWPRYSTSWYVAWKLIVSFVENVLIPWDMKAQSEVKACIFIMHRGEIWSS